MSVEYNVLVIKCDGVVFQEIAMPKGKIGFELATEVFDPNAPALELVSKPHENILLHPRVEIEETVPVWPQELTAPCVAVDDAAFPPDDPTEEEEHTEQMGLLSCADVTEAFFSDEIAFQPPSLEWIEDETHPLDERQIPNLHLKMGREPHPLARARTPFWPATTALFLAALLSLGSLGWLMSKTSTETVSEEFVRVTVQAEPVKKSIPPTPKKRVQKKTKARGKRTAKAADASAAPSSARNTEAALASLSQLTTGVTHLDVVQSRSKSGTKVSGEVQAYRGEGRIRSGVGRITTAQGAVASSDANSTVQATTQRFVSSGRQGSVRKMKAEGALSKEAITAVVTAHLGEVRACYERYLSSQNTNTGQIVARWTIQPDGSVSTASTAMDTLGETRTTGCILRAIRTWRFPKPEGGTVRVDYPFHFQPSGS